MPASVSVVLPVGDEDAVRTCEKKDEHGVIAGRDA